MPQQSERLHAMVRAWITDALAAAGSAPPGGVSFDELAVAIARYQAERVPAAAAAFAACGLAPASVTSAIDIPALTTELFRLRRIAAHGPELDERRFRTSGTTAGRQARGEHALRTTATYRTAALGWAGRMLWPDRRNLRLASLCAPERLAPDSSLSFMLARFAEHLEGEARWHFDGERLDLKGLQAQCARARQDGAVLLVAGTSFALVEVCDRLGAGELALPEASRVMQTGGFKGRSREVPRAELRSAIARTFGLPESHVVGEYGMTELSSQLYEGTLARALGAGFPLARPDCYYPPPWVRVSAVDPTSFTPVSLAEVGVCRLVDLANVDSAVAIVTADVVREQADGSIELLGRLPGSEPRGCSLGLEEALRAQNRSGGESP